VEDKNVDQLAVGVHSGVDGRSQLANGTGQKVMSRVYDRELGEQGATPGVLVRSRAVINIHAELLGEVLSEVTVAHDDALKIALEEAYDVEFSLANKLLHAAFRAPHIVVDAEVDSPDTSSDHLAVLVIRLVVVARESEVCNAGRK
jgi:hypothetical protein